MTPRVGKCQISFIFHTLLLVEIYEGLAANFIIVQPTEAFLKVNVR